MSAPNDKTCCVLGGCGFLGSVTAVRLVRAGWKVRVFDKEGVDDSRLIPVQSQVDLVRGDFMHAGDLRAALEGVSTVFHFAGTTVPQTSMNDVDFDLHTNVIAAVRMLEMIGAMKIPRLVFSSSGGTVYGIADRPQPISETHSTEPISAYGISKLMAEKYISLFARMYAFRHVILRFANPYGENQNPLRLQGAVGVFLERAMRNEEIVIWGDGTVVRDYVYQDDVAEAVLAVADRPEVEGIFNVGSGTGTVLTGVVDAVRQVLGGKVSVRMAPSRSFDVPYNVLDCTRIQKATGWRSRVSLDEGVSRMRDQIMRRG